jgi:hypothetical protein
MIPLLIPVLPHTKYSYFSKDPKIRQYDRISLDLRLQILNIRAAFVTYLGRIYCNLILHNLTTKTDRQSRFKGLKSSVNVHIFNY